MQLSDIVGDLSYLKKTNLEAMLKNSILYNPQIEACSVQQNKHPKNHSNYYITNHWLFKMTYYILNNLRNMNL